MREHKPNNGYYCKPSGTNSFHVWEKIEFKDLVPDQWYDFMIIDNNYNYFGRM